MIQVLVCALYLPFGETLGEILHLSAPQLPTSVEAKGSCHDHVVELSGEFDGQCIMSLSELFTVA